ILAVGPTGILPVDRSIAIALSRYGVGAGVARLFDGGDGGVIRQSINFQTANTNNAVMIAATNWRGRVRLLRKGVDPLRQRKIEQTSNTRNLFCKRRFLLHQNQAGGGGRPRILRRFLSESKSSTATERDC